MPNTERQAHVQFRLDKEVFALLQERVAELRTQGTLTTVNLYARSLLVAALGQSTEVAFADEIAMMAHAARNNISRRIADLLEANMDALVQGALTPPEPE
jgi:hypothetical protein